jgi:D-glycero-beta-D-manno-heptose-7-phosphate kinase
MPLDKARSEPVDITSLHSPARLIAAFSGRRVAVIGDAMLDHFAIGRVARISPEAPVPVVEHQSDEYRLGGAANVANNVRALGGEPLLVAAIGEDEVGRRFRDALSEAPISDTFLVVDPARQTTRKLRIVTDRRQQVARVDYESDAELSGAAEDELIARASTAAARADIVVVSDYLKGCITRRLMQELVAHSARSGRLLLVDPKIPHLDYYAGASLITPNHHEAEIATHCRIRSDEDACRAARVFRERARCRSVMITRGEHGLCVLEGEAVARGAAHEGGIATEGHLAARTRDVADVTGAGDTVIATMAIALAAGATLLEAAELANDAAGISVARFGPAAVTREELLEAIR